MGTLTAQIQLTEAELKLLQTLVYQECGMFFDERRSHFLKDRLQRRLKACQLDSFYSYYRLLTSREGKAELALLLENLTVNETSFFRNQAATRSFAENRSRRTCFAENRNAAIVHLRVWSAGCSSGQEAYSVAILIADALAYYYLRNPLPFEMPSPKPLIPPPWKLEIVASDISYASLRAGQEGLYTEQQMEPVDYTCPLALLRKSRRQICRQEAAQRTGSIRLSQSENRIPAAPQRHDPLPQRHDLFRRSRAKAPDRKVLAAA